MNTSEKTAKLDVRSKLSTLWILVRTEDSVHCVQHVVKRFILDVETDLGIEPDNLEGVAFGAALPDGRLPLVLMSDNNFAANRVTQFIVLAVTLAGR